MGQCRSREQEHLQVEEWFATLHSIKANIDGVTGGLEEALRNLQAGTTALDAFILSKRSSPLAKRESATISASVKQRDSQPTVIDIDPSTVKNDFKSYGYVPSHKQVQDEVLLPAFQTHTPAVSEVLSAPRALVMDKKSPTTNEGKLLESWLHGSAAQNPPSPQPSHADVSPKQHNSGLDCFFSGPLPIYR